MHVHSEYLYRLRHNLSCYILHSKRNCALPKPSLLYRGSAKKTHNEIRSEISFKKALAKNQHFSILVLKITQI